MQQSLSRVTILATALESHRSLKAFALQYVRRYLGFHLHLSSYRLLLKANSHLALLVANARCLWAGMEFIQSEYHEACIKATN